MNTAQQAACVSSGRSAKALLAEAPAACTVRALACRADELRFGDPPAALEVATAALEAQAALPSAFRRPRLVALAWSVFGSCCRAQARFDEAEFAFNRAGEALPHADARGHAEVARRFADLRADQRQGQEAKELMAGVLTYWRRFGGRELGKRLCTSGAILVRLNAYREAAADLEESLTLLAPTGDRFHVAALLNLAVCRVELSSGRSSSRPRRPC